MDLKGTLKVTLEKMLLSMGRNVNASQRFKRLIPTVELFAMNYMISPYPTHYLFVRHGGDL
jgi:hypothetical protein